MDPLGPGHSQNGDQWGTPDFETIFALSRYGDLSQNRAVLQERPENVVALAELQEPSDGRRRVERPGETFTELFGQVQVYGLEFRVQGPQKKLLA